MCSYSDLVQDSISFSISNLGSSGSVITVETSLSATDKPHLVTRRPESFERF